VYQKRVSPTRGELLSAQRPSSASSKLVSKLMFNQGLEKNPLSKIQNIKNWVLASSATKRQWSQTLYLRLEPPLRKRPDLYRMKLAWSVWWLQPKTRSSWNFLSLRRLHLSPWTRSPDFLELKHSTPFLQWLTLLDIRLSLKLPTTSEGSSPVRSLLPVDFLLLKYSSLEVVSLVFQPWLQLRV